LSQVTSTFGLFKQTRTNTKWPPDVFSVALNWWIKERPIYLCQW